MGKTKTLKYKNCEGGYKQSFLKMLPVLLLVGVVPLIVWQAKYDTKLTGYPWFSDREVLYEFFLAPKSTIITIIVFVMAVIVGMRAWKMKKKMPFTKVIVPLIVYIALVILSAIFSINKAFSFGGSYEQFETIWVILSYVLTVYYVLVYAESKEEEEARIEADNQLQESINEIDEKIEHLDKYAEKTTTVGGVSLEQSTDKLKNYNYEVFKKPAFINGKTYTLLSTYNKDDFNIPPSTGFYIYNFNDEVVGFPCIGINDNFIHYQLENGTPPYQYVFNENKWYYRGNNLPIDVNDIPALVMDTSKIVDKERENLRILLNANDYEDVPQTLQEKFEEDEEKINKNKEDIDELYDTVVYNNYEAHYHPSWEEKSYTLTTSLQYNYYQGENSFKINVERDDDDNQRVYEMSYINLEKDGIDIFTEDSYYDDESRKYKSDCSEFWITQGYTYLWATEEFDIDSEWIYLYGGLLETGTKDIIFNTAKSVDDNGITREGKFVHSIGNNGVERYIADINDETSTTRGDKETYSRNKIDNIQNNLQQVDTNEATTRSTNDNSLASAISDRVCLVKLNDVVLNNWTDAGIPQEFDNYSYVAVVRDTNIIGAQSVNVLFTIAQILSDNYCPAPIVDNVEGTIKIFGNDNMTITIPSISPITTTLYCSVTYSNLYVITKLFYQPSGGSRLFSITIDIVSST